MGLLLPLRLWLRRLRLSIVHLIDVGAENDWLDTHECNFKLRVEYERQKHIQFRLDRVAAG